MTSKTLNPLAFSFDDTISVIIVFAGKGRRFIYVALQRLCNISRQSFLSSNTYCILSPGLLYPTINLRTTLGLKASQVTANPMASKLKSVYS